ncbi:MAG: glycerol-3-phosphate 1-O-acyltransferase PlsY [Alphaproteobacteria bacterium]
MWWNFDAAPTFAWGMIPGAIFGYLLGSIPFGLVFTRMAGLGDIRSIGSGNIGATNVLRTGNKPLALATLLADGGKGAVAVLIAGMLGGPIPSVAAGCAAFAGHIYPVWLNFKGGKGVATYFGILIAFAWPIGLAAGASWIATAFLFRYSSLAALAAAVLAPIFFIIGGLSWLAIPAALCGVLIYWRHRSNIARLLSGKEPRIGENADPAAAKP